MLAGRTVTESRRTRTSEAGVPCRQHLGSRCSGPLVFWRRVRMNRLVLLSIVLLAGSVFSASGSGQHRRDQSGTGGDPQGQGPGDRGARLFRAFVRGLEQRRPEGPDYRRGRRREWRQLPRENPCLPQRGDRGGPLLRGLLLCPKSMGRGTSSSRRKGAWVVSPVSWTGTRIGSKDLLVGCGDGTVKVFPNFGTESAWVVHGERRSRGGRVLYARCRGAGHAQPGRME